MWLLRQLLYGLDDPGASLHRRDRFGVRPGTHVPVDTGQYSTGHWPASRLAESAGGVTGTGRSRDPAACVA